MDPMFCRMAVAAVVCRSLCAGPGAPGMTVDMRGGVEASVGECAGRSGHPAGAAVLPGRAHAAAEERTSLARPRRRCTGGR